MTTELQKQLDRDYAIATSKALADYCSEIDLIELPDRVRDYFGGSGKVTVSQDNQFPTTFYLQFDTEGDKPFLQIATEPDFYSEWDGRVIWQLLENYGGYAELEGVLFVASPTKMTWNLFEQLNEKLGDVCPNHEGSFDCTPFCPKCEGNQYIN